jgi:hypothetical protein
LFLPQKLMFCSPSADAVIRERDLMTPKESGLVMTGAFAG